MTGIIDDQNAARALVCGAYLRLKSFDPHHRALKYLVEKGGNYFLNPARAREFDRAFADELWDPQRKGKGTPMSIKLCHYYIALKRAADSLGASPSR
jgi:hypothetical protein